MVAQRQAETPEAFGERVPAKRRVVRDGEHVPAALAQGREGLWGAGHGVVVIDQRAVQVEQVGRIVGERASD